MKSPKRKKAGPTGNQSVIVRFRASYALYKRLKCLAKQEEMSMAGLVKRLVLDTLSRFPSSQEQ